MSIRTKIITIVIAMFVLSASVNFIALRFVIFPSFLKLEQREAGENLRRIIRAVDREIFHLDKLCSDWATWNESYSFVETLSDKYIEDNLIIDAFATNRVNLISYFRNDGSLVWGKAYDLENESILALPFLQNRKLDASHPMIALKASPSGNLSRVRSGVIMTAYGPMIFASRSILRTDETGPARGVLTMGRLLNAETVASLVEQTRINFTIDYPLTPETIERKEKKYTAHREPDLTYYADKQKQHIDIWTMYYDARGKAAFSISCHYPREITQKGLTSIRYALAIAVGTALAILLIIVIFLQLVVVQPIKKLTDHASRLDREGDYSIQLAFNRRDELGRLARVLDFTSATIAERTDELKSVNKKLEKLSSVDALTGVANRRMFDDHMEKEWLRAARQKTRLSLILVDVDHFKHYNDFYGHQKGDRCLRAIASAIQRQVTRPADLVARYGGEEFAVILPETEAKGAWSVAEKIRLAVNDLQINHQGSEAADVVTLSLGVASMAPDAKDQRRTLIQKADEALYQAKRTGRNRAVLSEMNSGIC